MDVRTTPNDVEDMPLGKRPKGRSRKNQWPTVSRPTLPAEAERSFRHLMDLLLSNDLDISCRTALALQQVGQAELMHQVLCELLAAGRSRSLAEREKASAMLFILAPRLFGHPLAPPSLDDLAKGLRHPDPKVRAQAAEAIGDRGKEAAPALDALQQTLTDPEPEVQFRVAVAIGAITGSIPPKPRTVERTGGGHSGGQGDRKGEDSEHPE
jgi:hypothetical protein